ncbi:MAG: hypothetical protein DHS20C15_09080 [Planctomycetota bacterium]|nr:MAG: hypothetical protein DHS20C15_09080 [Planctomycetota bacterium]
MSSPTLDTLFPAHAAVVLDGAMGTALQARGWPAQRSSLLANLEHPDWVADVHAAHLDAGAELLCTNTFAALAPPTHEHLDAVRAGVQLAREAAGERARVAGSVAGFDLAQHEAQLESVVAALVEGGVDLLLFETCNELRDADAAFQLRARLAPRLPCVISASSTDGSHADRSRVREVIEFVRRQAERGVEAGLNCCRGPHDALRLAEEQSAPVRWLKPSTGLPGDRASDDVMAAFARAARLGGARFLGGCCGADAATLLAMRVALRRV